MAHKHNRRRGRPRSRRHQNRNNSTSSDGSHQSYQSYQSYNSGFSYDSLSQPPQFTDTTSQPVGANAATTLNDIHEFVPGAARWTGHDQGQISWGGYVYQHTSVAQLYERSQQKTETPEATRIRIFGGMPEDETDLCDKMMEVFEGMSWLSP